MSKEAVEDATKAGIRTNCICNKPSGHYKFCIVNKIKVAAEFMAKQYDSIPTWKRVLKEAKAQGRSETLKEFDNTIREMIFKIQTNQGVENWEQLKEVTWAYSDPVGALEWVRKVLKDQEK